MNQKEIKKARRICENVQPREKGAFHYKDTVLELLNDNGWRFYNYTMNAFPDALDEIEHLREILGLAWISLCDLENVCQSRIQQFDEFRNRYCEFKIRDEDHPENPIVELKEKP